VCYWVAKQKTEALQVFYYWCWTRDNARLCCHCRWLPVSSRQGPLMGLYRAGVSHSSRFGTLRTCIARDASLKISAVDSELIVVSLSPSYREKTDPKLFNTSPVSSYVYVNSQHTCSVLLSLRRISSPNESATQRLGKIHHPRMVNELVTVTAQILKAPDRYFGLGFFPRIH
jgi:hypothetical protein